MSTEPYPQGASSELGSRRKDKERVSSEVLVSSRHDWHAELAPVDVSIVASCHFLDRTTLGVNRRLPIVVVHPDHLDAFLSVQGKHHS